MNFEERSYSPKIYRPRPEFSILEQEQLLVLATPWSTREIAKQVTKQISDFVVTHFRDPDSTSPFPRIPGLSDIANTIRTGALLANDSLHKSANKDEYTSGVELFVGMKKSREVSWLQIGQPNIILLRKGRNPLCLSANLDLSVEINKDSDPLPGDCLGLQAIPPLFINTLRYQDGDRIMLLSHSWVPDSVFSLSEEQWTLDGISKAIVTATESQPFWLGLWDLAGG